jgi:transposase
MISSIRLDGSTACMTVDGATDTDVFQAYVQFVLKPTLRPGDLVVLDNLSPHKGAGALRLIEQAGATVCFLPPYSPDMNPIEMMWSKVKTCLRSEKARSEEALTAAIARSLGQVTAADARNWFAACGYSII